MREERAGVLQCCVGSDELRGSVSMKWFAVLSAMLASAALAAWPNDGAPKYETDRGTVGFLHYNLLSGGDLHYPRDAWQTKLQGSGFFLMRLRPDGGVESVTVKSSTGYKALDESVAVTLKGYRFKAKTQGPLLWLVSFAQPATVIVKVMQVKEHRESGH